MFIISSKGKNDNMTTSNGTTGREGTECRLKAF
jgi:hypothetical protein